MPFRALTLVLAAVALLASSCSDAPKTRVLLRGAGATFPARLYQKWIADYHAAHPDVKVEYQAMGSGVGIQQFAQGLVDFGASDAAMTDEQLRSVPTGGVQLVPLTAGMVVLAYNVPGVTGELKLSREAYTGIFLGTILSWDDPKIVECNKETTLPKTPIQAVRRAGASGTTFVFTQHLSAVSEPWKKGPGSGLSVNWPTGLLGKGNDGIATLIQQTPGAIGYLEYGFAEKNKLALATLQNKAGEYVKPSQESGQATLGTVQLPETLRAWVPDPEGKECYPIVSFTWLLIHQQYPNPKVAAALKDFLKYSLADGQKDCAPLGYLPLPAKVRQTVTQVVDKLAP